MGLLTYLFVLNLHSMRSLFTIFLALISLFAFSQNDRRVFGEIDSISQNRWDAVALNLDSLADPKFEKFEVHFKDTIVIRNQEMISESDDNIPVTPYNILQLKDPIKWFYYGNNSMTFNQSSFSNWNSGGNNNIGIIGYC